MARCAAIKRSGGQCRGTPIDGSEWCYVHHPDYAEKRKRDGSRGGRRGGRGRPTSDLASVRLENAVIRKRLLEGDLSPGIASVAVQSLNVDIRAVLAALKAKEIEELEQRLEALEEAHEAKPDRAS